MLIAVDIDGVLCDTKGTNYARATPKQGAIEKMRKLIEEGHDVYCYTARGSSLGSVAAAENAYGELTRRQLSEWGVPNVEIVFGKAIFDVLIDDRALNGIVFPDSLEL